MFDNKDSISHLEFLKCIPEKIPGDGERHGGLAAAVHGITESRT